VPCGQDDQEDVLEVEDQVSSAGSITTEVARGHQHATPEHNFNLPTIPSLWGRIRGKGHGPRACARDGTEQRVKGTGECNRNGLLKHLGTDMAAYGSGVWKNMRISGASALGRAEGKKNCEP